MSLSKKYCDHLISDNSISRSDLLKDIKTPTPTPCQDDGEDTGRGALRLQTWTSPQQNTNLLDQHINDLISREHKAFLKVVLIKLTLNGSLGRNVDMQRLRIQIFPKFFSFLTKSALKQASLPGHMSKQTSIDPPTSWNPYCQVAWPRLQECPLTKAVPPGVLYTLAQCPSASILIRLWYSMQHLEMGKINLYCGSWRKVQTRFFDNSKNVRKIKREKKKSLFLL